ncbi:MAG: hypothetical protein AAGI03_02785, partial [Pseudomonadota bacterium]
MNDPDRIPLTRLAHELSAAGHNPPPYRRIYAAALNAEFPAHQGVGNRWSVAREDLDQIVSALGLSADDRVAA